ncbi:MAG: sigma-70 family RNA polymerase sigma factor [Planctomycetota bacterium]|nr:sigma-70 family RNA polymerase sigma factor [Planctomycetota bacterium]
MPGLTVAEHDQRPLDRDPDLEALEAFRAGRQDAFDSLVERHQRRIFRLACRLLGDRDAALDAAQETFVKAWKALPRFEGKARFSTWLTRIAINQCRNELRKRGTVKHTRPLSLDAPVAGTESSRVESIASPQPSAWDEARGREVREAFAAVMTELDPDAREVLILTEVEALSYEGIAELLDVPVGTVRSRLHRARADVRQRMAVVLGSSSS